MEGRAVPGEEQPVAECAIECVTAAGGGPIPLGPSTELSVLRQGS